MVLLPTERLLAPILSKLDLSELLFVPKTTQPVEKPYCRALKGRKAAALSHMMPMRGNLTAKRGISHSRKLFSLVFQQAGPYMGRNGIAHNCRWLTE